MDLYQQRREVRRHVQAHLQTQMDSEAGPNGTYAPRKPVIVKIDYVEIAPKQALPQPLPPPTLPKMDSMLDLVQLISDASSTSTPTPMDVDASDGDFGLSLAEDATVSSSSNNEEPRLVVPQSNQSAGEEWLKAFSRHQQQEREEWEKSFVGSKAHIPMAPLKADEMDELIRKHGRSLPSAASLLFSLLDNNQQGGDDLFGT